MHVDFINVFAINVDVKSTCAEPCRAVTDAMMAKMRFYNERLHRAAFIMPTFVERAIAKARRDAADVKKAK